MRKHDQTEQRGDADSGVRIDRADKESVQLPDAHGERKNAGGSEDKGTRADGANRLNHL